MNVPLLNSKSTGTAALLLSLGLISFGCGGSKDPVTELENSAKALAAEEKSKPKATAPADGEFDPSQFNPSKEVSQAVSDYKAGKMEDAVTRLQLLRTQAAISAEQRVALQDSIATLMGEIYEQAAKGDARAQAAVAQYERLNTRR